MRGSAFVCLLLSVLDASVASAAGVNLRWDKCFGEGTGAVHRTFACDTNVGTQLVVGSFVLGTGANQVSHLDTIVDLASSGAILPAWWEVMNPGACRAVSLGLNSVADPANTVCEDWGQGLASGGVTAYLIGARGANTARILLSVSVPPSGLQSLVTGLEYFSFNLTLNNSGTVGAGACGGCTAGVCIVLNSLDVMSEVAGQSRKLTAPSNGTDSNFVTWQGGGNPSVGTITGCPAATPTRATTWGAVKRLYR